MMTFAEEFTALICAVTNAEHTPHWRKRETVLNRVRLEAFDQLQDAIQAFVDQRRTVSAHDVACEFCVPDSTARRHLSRLASSGRIVRIEVGKRGCVFRTTNRS